MTTEFTDRRLGESGPIIGPMGLGTWAMGGPFSSGPDLSLPTGSPLGYGAADDEQSIRALHCAVEMGATLFDTADAYGAGHGERILGRALKGKRDQVIIASKFGNTYNEQTRQLGRPNLSPKYIRKACIASLERLQTTWIDLYQLHIGDMPLEQADNVADTLDGLCTDGLIRSYGWSTDDPERGAAFANRPNAVALQFQLNVLQDAPEMINTCQKNNFAGLVRSPLAMGLLSGKYSASSILPADDIRSQPPEWLPYFEQGGRASPALSQQLAQIREVLTSGGRTLVQGALAWIWGRSACTIPIPGIRTEAQVKENLEAIPFGPLSENQMREIKYILNRP